MGAYNTMVPRPKRSIVVVFICDNIRYNSVSSEWEHKTEPTRVRLAACGSINNYNQGAKYHYYRLHIRTKFRLLFLLLLISLYLREPFQLTPVALWSIARVYFRIGMPCEPHHGALALLFFIIAMQCFVLFKNGIVQKCCDESAQRTKNSIYCELSVWQATNCNVANFTLLHFKTGKFL